MALLVAPRPALALAACARRGRQSVLRGRLAAVAAVPPRLRQLFVLRRHPRIRNPQPIDQLACHSRMAGPGEGGHEGQESGEGGFPPCVAQPATGPPNAAGPVNLSGRPNREHLNLQPAVRPTPSPHHNANGTFPLHPVPRLGVRPAVTWASPRRTLRERLPSFPSHPCLCESLPSVPGSRPCRVPPCPIRPTPSAYSCQMLKGRRDWWDKPRSRQSHRPDRHRCRKWVSRECHWALLPRLLC